MKKLIVITVMFAAAASFAAQEKYTNAVERARIAVEKGLVNYCNYRMVPESDIAEVDEIISSAGLFWYKTPSAFPKTKANYMKWLKENRPGFYAYTMVKDKDGDAGVLADADVYANSIDIYPDHCGIFVLDNYKRAMIRFGMRNVKVQLRKEGKSFVTKDGVNPIQQRIDALTNALDAPRFAGLKEAMAGVGINLYVDPAAAIPPATEIEKLKDEVFYGRVAFSEQVRGTLSCALGVKAYNEFVKKYNGEE